MQNQTMKYDYIIRSGDQERAHLALPTPYDAMHFGPFVSTLIIRPRPEHPILFQPLTPAELRALHLNH
jgi:hypothetical protein